MINAEIHLTIELTPVVESVFSSGEYAGYKLSTIFLYDKLGNVVDTHSMLTTKVSKPTYQDLLNFVEEFKEVVLTQSKVLRVKVEVCPTSLIHIPFEPLYVESHFQFLNLVLDRVKNSNPFLKDYAKSRSKGKNMYSLTCRSYDINSGTSTIKQHWEILSNQYSDMEKLELEYCVLDTNPELDKGWL